MKSMTRLSILLLLLSIAPPLRADIDTSRIIRGRTTYPAKSWALDIDYTQIGEHKRDTCQDRSSFNLEIERGVSDRLTLEMGLKTKEERKDFFTPSRLIFEARYMLIREPLQFTPFLEYLPSLRKESEEYAFGAEIMKNLGRWSLHSVFEGEFEKEPGRDRALNNHILLGSYYRFGINGMAGLAWHYKSSGAQSLSINFGAAASKNLFLGIQPHFGLTPQAPNLEMTLQVHILFSRHSLGEWLLE